MNVKEPNEIECSFLNCICTTVRGYKLNHLAINLTTSVAGKAGLPYFTGVEFYSQVVQFVSANGTYFVIW